MNRAPKAELAFGAFSFWRREREMGFAKVSSLTNLSLKKSAFVFRSSREPPIIRAFERPSKSKRKESAKAFFSFWRRRRDSNPRGLSPKRFSRPPRYDRFDTPALLFFYLSIIPAKRGKVNGFYAWKYKIPCKKLQGIYNALFDI